MALEWSITCKGCKKEVIIHKVPGTELQEFCDDCVEKGFNKQMEDALKEVRKLPLEKRIERIEELIYKHSYNHMPSF